MRHTAILAIILTMKNFCVGTSFARSPSAGLLGLVAVLLLALTPSPQAAQEVALGPVDGHDLPPADLERVVAGVEAPLFTLESLRNGVVELASFRGQKNVVLVFYRGHW